MRKTIAGALLLAGIAAACSTADDPGKGSGRPDASTGPATDSNNTTNPPPADLNDDLSCEADAVGWAVARGTLTNHSSGASSYVISVNFTNAGGTIYANGTAFVTDVPAGGTATWEANSLADVQSGACTVVEVNRNAA